MNRDLLPTDDDIAEDSEATPDFVAEVTPITGLSDGVVDRLYAPFGLYEHEFHPFHKFCYIKEEAINTRLTQIFGLEWSKRVISREYVPAGGPVRKAPGRSQAFIPAEVGDEGAIYDLGYAIVHTVIEIGRHTRGSIGGDYDVSLGKEPGARIMNTIKSADTDSFKRAARQWGIGLYLTDIRQSDNVNDFDSLKKWLHRKFPQDLRFHIDAEARALLARNLHVKFPEIFAVPQDVGRALSDLEIAWIQDNIYQIYDALVQYALLQAE